MLLELVQNGQNSAIDSLCLMLNRGPTIVMDFDLQSRRVLYFAWGFASVILGGLYSGFLVSNQVAVTIAKPFNDLNQLADALSAGRFRLLISSASSQLLHEIDLGGQGIL